jgi:hypothetical protein
VDGAEAAIDALIRRWWTNIRGAWHCGTVRRRPEKGCICHGNVVEFTPAHLTKRLHDHSLNGLQLLRVLKARIGW